MKRALTLIELMIVILLITLVTGVVGYNMKGSLDRGKAFRTEAAIEQLHDLLILIATENRDLTLEKLVALDFETLSKKLKNTGLAKNPDELLKDGWGNRFELKLSKSKKDVEIISERHAEYKKKTAM